MALGREGVEYEEIRRYDGRRWYYYQYPKNTLVGYCWMPEHRWQRVSIVAVLVNARGEVITGNMRTLRDLMGENGIITNIQRTL